MTATNANPQLLGTGVTSATGSGTTGVFTVAVSSLTPGTAYSYAAYATNAADTGYTSVGTFTTPCQAITLTNSGTASGTAGTAFTATFTQSGCLGTPAFSKATGTLPTGLTLSSAGILSGTPTQTGTFPITVTATDTNGCAGTGATYTLVIGCQTITVTKPVTANGTAGTAFSQSFTQSGGIGTTTFTKATGALPAGLTLSSAGLLSGTPTVIGPFSFTVTAL